MNDDELWDAFADCSLPAGAFPHSVHVRIAWLHLRRHPLEEVVSLFPENLRRFTTAKGAPERYHQTITWAFLLLVNERMHRNEVATWSAFAEGNRDLLDRGSSILKRYYRDDTLRSSLARDVFVLPDAAYEIRTP